VSAAAGILIILLSLALAGVCVRLYRRERLYQALIAATNHFVSVVRSGRASDRVRGRDPGVGAFAEAANLLLEQTAQRRLQVSERECALDAVMSNAQEAVAIHRESIMYCNERFATLFGLSDTLLVNGKTLADLVPVGYGALVMAHLERVLGAESASERLKLEVQGAEQQTTPVELLARRIDYPGGPALLLKLSPTRALRFAEPVEDSARERALEVLESLGEGLITTDVDGAIDYINSTGESLLGMAAGEVLGKQLTEAIKLVDASERHSLGDPVAQCLATRSKVIAGRRGLKVSRGPGNGERLLELSVTPLDAPEGSLVGTVVLLRDVSEMRATLQTSYHVSHDALTGLFNRREFERRLEESLRIVQGAQTQHVLAHVDLDRFRTINDTCGTMAADLALREVAGLIREIVRDTDSVGRLGGDEFGMLLIGCPLEKARQIANDLVRKMAAHRFTWQGRDYPLELSVGLLEISRDSGSPADIMNAADSACYLAKQSGIHVHVYAARDEVVARQRGESQWLQKLQVALQENRFELMAQPIVATASVAVQGPALEALLRLQDGEAPDGVSPTEFLRAAERYRLMPHVDRWVVQTALTALGQGGIRLPPNRSLALNLSGQTLGDPSFLEFAVDCLDRTGVMASQVCFEVTEQSVIDNMEQAQRFIGVLHGMGCRFALDDFGRGLSSFGNLKSLPLDYLKIDGLFVRTLAADSVHQAMVAAMIKMARTLNFQIIAEHVEDAAALEMVRKMGVDFVQGYHLGKPQRLIRVMARRPVPGPVEVPATPQRDAG
jgi:diguanylate cyclase (GGDEF)-like protein/PAS domain S-box-containing protein